MDMLQLSPAFEKGGTGVQRGNSKEVTELLVRWRGGDKAALDALMPLVYAELRRIAQFYLNKERHDHTLQGTALVHEAYVRLTEQNLPEWQNRAHFFAVAARLMRQILVDYARTHGASKRGGDVLKLALDEAEEQAQPFYVDVVALDDALNSLALLDQQQCRIVELKFFGGLTAEDTAEVMGISVSTVKRDWFTARAWLYRELDRRTAI